MLSHRSATRLPGSGHPHVLPESHGASSPLLLTHGGAAKPPPGQQTQTGPVPPTPAPPRPSKATDPALTSHNRQRAAQPPISHMKPLLQAETGRGEKARCARGRSAWWHPTEAQLRGARPQSTQGCSRAGMQPQHPPQGTNSSKHALAKGTEEQAHFPLCSAQAAHGCLTTAWGIGWERGLGEGHVAGAAAGQLDLSPQTPCCGTRSRGAPAFASPPAAGTCRSNALALPNASAPALCDPARLQPQAEPS